MGQRMTMLEKEAFGRSNLPNQWRTLLAPPAGT
jgi:hypothetical protein